MAAALEGKWRRVSSTHALSDLLQPPAPAPGPSLALLALGALLATLSASALAATTAVFARAWLLAAATPALYYAQLLPALLPVSVAYVVCNWFGMKLFKHNH